jgi:rRNA maturation protein Nop10
VAAGPVEDAGEFTTCPSCGAEVRKKAMIPVLRAIVPAGYLCRDCARATLADRAPSDGAGGAEAAQKPAASEPAARPTSPGSSGAPTR